MLNDFEEILKEVDPIKNETPQVLPVKLNKQMSNEENWLDKIANITLTSNKSSVTTKIDSKIKHIEDKLVSTSHIEKSINRNSVSVNQTTELSLELSDSRLSNHLTTTFNSKIPEELIKAQSNNLSEVFKNSSPAKYLPSAIKIDDPESYESIEKTENWTYKKLVESESLKKFTLSIVKQLRKTIENNYTNYCQYEFEWCIMVDNSGSMSTKSIFVAETLVVLIEVLRRIEHKFAIARFGSINDKKALLKGFEDPMSMARGQHILESLTYNQGTYIFQGLERVTSKIWPGKKQSAKNQRILLMITDGLTTEKDSDPIKTLKFNSFFKLGAVILKEKDQTFYSERLLKEITDRNSNDEPLYKILNYDESNRLPFKFLCVMVDVFEEITKNNSSLANNAIQTSESDISERIKIPFIKPSNENSFDDHINNLFENIGKLDYEFAKNKGHIKPNLMFKVNANNDIFKFLLNNSFNENNSNKLDLRDKTAALEKYYSSLLTDHSVQNKLNKIEKKWNEIEAKLFKQITDYADVLQTTVFPPNKFTRKKASSKGSDLYMPGLVNAFITNFNDKKIYSIKKEGPKKLYSIAIVVDVSYSMNGHVADCVVEVLISFISSLQKIQIENYSIILFGKEVKIIKLESQSWDARVMFALFDNLRFDNDYVTNDADAIETAISLLQNSSGSTSKKIFCFTDGYSSCSTKLVKALKKADSLNIEAIGISVGFDKPIIQNSYKMYIHVALPFAFHQALKALFENNEEGVEIKDLEAFHEACVDDAHGILKELQSSQFINDMNGEREAKLVQGNATVSEFSIDICFVLDCTGSMTHWLQFVKKQMKSIVENIRKNIETRHSSIKLVMKIGVLGFRDFSEMKTSKQFEELVFTENMTEFDNFLNELKAFGGYDIAEDVIGNLILL